MGGRSSKQLKFDVSFSMSTAAYASLLVAKASPASETVSRKVLRSKSSCVDDDNFEASAIRTTPRKASAVKKSDVEQNKNNRNQCDAIAMVNNY